MWELRPPHFRLGLGSILQLLGGFKCEIRPWVESSGFEGGRKSSEIAFRMAIEMKTCDSGEQRTGRFGCIGAL